MNNFNFYSPTFFCFGKDTEKETGNLVKRFGGTKVLIHYGGGSVVRSGLLDRVRKSLEEAGVPYAELGGVQPNPRSGLVYQGIELVRKEQVDFLARQGCDMIQGFYFAKPMPADEYEQKMKSGMATEEVVEEIKVEAEADAPAGESENER